MQADLMKSKQYMWFFSGIFLLVISVACSDSDFSAKGFQGKSGDLNSGNKGNESKSGRSGDADGITYHSGIEGDFFGDGYDGSSDGLGGSGDGSLDEDGNLRVGDGEDTIKACVNDGPRTFAGDPRNLANQIRAASAAKGQVIPGNKAMRRSTNGSGGSFRWTNLGTEDLPTLRKACEILGYAEYKSSGCYDEERSSRYPNGKCNYHSPEDDSLAHWTGSQWVDLGNQDKYRFTWISSLTCDVKICD